MEELSSLSSKAQYDLKLVQAAIRKGDQKAYASLMGRYRDSVYFMLLKMVGNKDDADDLTIEAFGKAFKRLDQYTPNFAFSTWLFKIATNNCIDFIRKKKNNTFSIDKPYENDEGGELNFTLRSDFPDPEETMQQKQKINMMHDVVDKLKPRYRQLVEMRYFEELSYEEISLKLELPIGTVKAQLFRARELLLHIMKNSEGRF
jgi:RNA polymerase sigma factor (sigma-70 family)